MKTAKELYKESKAKSEDALYKVLHDIQEGMIIAASKGAYNIEVHLYKYPILYQYEALTQLLKDFHELGFKTFPDNIVDKAVHSTYPSLETFTITWGNPQ